MTKSDITCGTNLKAGPFYIKETYCFSITKALNLQVFLTTFTPNFQKTSKTRFCLSDH